MYESKEIFEYLITVIGNVTDSSSQIMPPTEALDLPVIINIE